MNTKKYIAFICVWIYIFPLVYQPIHIYKHPIHFDKEEKNIIIASETSKQIFQFHATHKKCPICEFTFFIRTLPPFSVFESKLNQLKIIFHENITKRLFTVFTINISQRAPPAIF